MKRERGLSNGGTKGHPEFWAALTVAVFPIVTLALGWLGMDPFRGFLGGMVAALIIMLLEGMVRGRWWITDPAFARVFTDPAFTWRLLTIVGIVVFLFHTLILATFITGRGLDKNIVSFILSRQCASPTHPLIARLCRDAANPRADVDPALRAVREAAERRFFSGGLVTCAVRPLAMERTPLSCTNASIVRCDKWMIGTITRLPVMTETIERPVVASLITLPDGTYRVDRWADNPDDPAWSAIGGPVSEKASTLLQKASDHFRTELKTETFRRVMEQLRGQ